MNIETGWILSLTKKGLGFRRKGRFDRFIDVEECPIANQSVNAILTEVREWFDKNFDKLDVFDINRKRGTLRYVVIRSPDFSKKTCATFVLNPESTKISGVSDLIEEFAKNTAVDSVVIAYVDPHKDKSVSVDVVSVKGELVLNEDLCGKSFEYDTQGFFQNNSAMAAKMLDYVKTVMSKYDTKNGLLVDMYGGVGTFGIVCSDLFSEVITTENYEPSTKSAEKNIELNKVSNCKAVCADSAKIRKLLIGNNKDLYIIADPPRTGMDRKVIEHLLALEPKAIVYVSCNPKQLGKELFWLKEKYKVKSISIFDLFPQTPHVETVVELIRS